MHPEPGALPSRPVQLARVAGVAVALALAVAWAGWNWGNLALPAQLTGTEHFLSSQLVFFPVYRFTGSVVLGVNAVLLFAYPLAACAMNRLLASLGFRAGIAWPIGLVYALGPLQVPTSVHVLHVLAVYPPLVALALHRLREAPSRRHTAALGAVYTGIGLAVGSHYASVNSLLLPASVLVTALLLPLLAHFQVDPMMFGILIALNLQTSFLTPPMAMSAYYLKGIAPPFVQLWTIFRGCFPFLFMVFLAMVAVYVFPQTVFWLPDVIYGLR